MSSRRLFFALWPDAAMREALRAATRPVLDAVRGARPVTPGNLHVTLAFLGEVPESGLAALLELAERVAGESGLAAPLDVTLDTLDYWRRSRILCAMASRASAAAEGLVVRLRGALAKSGFSPDLKPFRAHVTLARQVRGVPPDLSMPPVPWRFGEFALVASRKEPEGSSYSIVGSWALNGGGGGAAGAPAMREKP